MEYRWIRDAEGFRALRKEWDDAILASGEDNPFLLSDFILTWWKHYSRDYKALEVFVVYEGGKIVCGLPLCRDKSGYLEYPGRIDANYTEFLLAKKDSFSWNIFFDALKELNGWRCIRLRRYRKSRIEKAGLNLPSSRYDNILVDAYISECAYLINIPEDFSDYLKRLPKKLRYYLRRSEQEFSKLGSVSLHSLKGCDGLGKLCDIHINLSRNAFRMRNKKSVFEDETHEMFFRELMRKFCEAGYLDANVLKLDDRIIAIHFGFSTGNNLNYILPTFDMDFARLNPGHLLIYKLVELGSKRKNKLLDLYTGRSLYKEQWSDYREDVVSLEIRPDCLRGRIDRAIARQVRMLSIAEKAKKVFAPYPLLMDMGRRLKEAVRNYV